MADEKKNAPQKMIFAATKVVLRTEVLMLCNIRRFWRDES